jgi:hypothetical protein
MRLRSLILAVIVLTPVVIALAPEPAADAASGIAAYVYSPAPGTVRLHVTTGDCSESGTNLFDGEIRAGETLRIPISSWCVCASRSSVRSATWGPALPFCSTPPPAAPNRHSRPPQPSNIRIVLDGNY